MMVSKILNRFKGLPEDFMPAFIGENEENETEESTNEQADSMTLELIFEGDDDSVALISESDESMFLEIIE
jgi:hypothetical protein